MLNRNVGRTLLAALFCCALALQASAGGGKDKVVKDKVVKDKVVKDDVKGKFEVPKDAIAGKMKSVDLKKSSFTVSVKDKDRTFLVDAKTEFYGPRGGDRGTGPKGLEDDCMEAGYEIRVVAAADGKTAKDVYLPNRKPEKNDKKDK